MYLSIQVIAKCIHEHTNKYYFIQNSHVDKGQSRKSHTFMHPLCMFANALVHVCTHKISVQEEL